MALNRDELTKRMPIEYHNDNQYLRNLMDSLFFPLMERCSDKREKGANVHNPSFLK
jgi:hypothetical protein